MKTAIQELIEKLSMKSGDSFYALAFYHDNDKIIKEALEKEKEQIIYAMERTAIYVSVASIDKEIGKMTIEDLYNQTYNN